MDIETILSSLGLLIGGGGLGTFIGWKAKKRQDLAEAKKTEAEAKSEQIENIEKLVEKAYKPIIEDLTGKVQKLNDKVSRLESTVEVLETENHKLRSIIREVRPDLVPSQRGTNGRKALRNPNGTFAKKEGGCDGQ